MIDFLDKQYLKYYILGVAGIAFIAVIIILIVTVSQNGGSKPADEPLNRKTLELRLSNYIIPDEWTEYQPLETVPFRPVHTRWTREEMERFWINPEILMKEYLREQTKQKIQGIMDTIP